MKMKGQEFERFRGVKNGNSSMTHATISKAEGNKAKEMFKNTTASINERKVKNQVNNLKRKKARKQNALMRRQLDAFGCAVVHS